MSKHRFLASALALVIGVASTSIVSFAASEPYVQSDTTVSFTRPQSETYQVKFTVYGTHDNPNIAAGNGSVLQTQNVTKTKDGSGNDVYLFKVKAIGSVGSTSAIYTTLPGQTAVRHFILTVGEPVSAPASTGSITLQNGAGTVERGHNATISIKGKPNTPYTLTVQYSTTNSQATNVGTTTSDGSGSVSWTWKVGGNTKPGNHPIIITGGGETYKTSFTTTV